MKSFCRLALFLICLSLLVFTHCPSAIYVSAQSQAKLTREQFFSLLSPKTGPRISLDDFLKGIKNRKVSFVVTEQDELRIRKEGQYLGSSGIEQLIAALRENGPRLPTPQITASYVENLNGVSLEMILVPTGKFTMGSNEKENEKPPREVIVPSFYIGKYEVTQKQWQAVMDENPSRFDGDDLPVEQVSWDEARAFCKKLTAMTGKTYRLPSEAEWEYACRAGTPGDYAGKLDEIAWYRDNSGMKTHPVGKKDANAFGLFDMHGNVWEWCEDVSHEDYNDAPKDGSAWKKRGDQGRRVRRGGSWGAFSYICRSASRDDNAPSARDADVGFRVVVSARTP